MRGGVRKRRRRNRSTRMGGRREGEKGAREVPGREEREEGTLGKKSRKTDKEREGG